MNRRIALALAASLTTAIVIAAVAASLTDRDATPADELPLIDANPTRTDPVDFGPFVVYSDTATAVPERQLANGDADLLPPTFDFATGSLISQSVHIAADDAGRPFEIRTSFRYELGDGIGRPAEVVRWRPKLPFPMTRPVAGGALALAFGDVRGAPAIFIGPRNLEPDQQGSFDILWIENGTLTWLTAAATLQQATLLAESIH